MNHEAIEASLANQLHYYRLILQDAGVADINQVLATRLAYLLKMNQAQEEYLKQAVLDSENKIKVSEMLDDLMVLVKAMQTSKEMNPTYLKAMKASLEQLKLIVAS